MEQTIRIIQPYRVMHVMRVTRTSVRCMHMLVILSDTCNAMQMW